ncbi:cell division protein ZipA [Thalassotalea sp. PLHSN55]|uniref:cell division protein ZipA n=1 Tax=Thalassotalea sp. PLHSN55 TaxID=3435888 RepID=UPI003F8437CF
MEDNVRYTLIIICAVIIGAICIHGLWKIRKNSNPYKLKAKNEPVQPQERGFDQSGFDQDGVGPIRVVGANALNGEIDNPPNDDEIAHQPAPAPKFSADPIPKDLLDEKAISLENEPNLGDLNLNEADAVMIQEAESKQRSTEEVLIAEQEVPPVAELELVPDLPPEPEVSVYQEPVTQLKPNMKKSPAKKPVRKSAKAELKRNQMEINFGDESANVKPTANIDPEVLVISVVMPENQIMSGAVLLPTLLTLGMKYGDMNIFHRHQDNAGNGKVTFSLANMLNPGTFDLDAMETFATQGVTLFMTLPNEGDPFEVFQQMLSAAKQLANEFHGQLLDDKRSVLTKQTEQHYMSKIREFDRKNRIAAL